MKIKSGRGWVEVSFGVPRIDKAWLRDNQDLLRVITSDEPAYVLLDLSGVALVDGSFLSIVSRLVEHCSPRGGRLFLARPPTILVNLLKGAAMTNNVDIVGDPQTDETWLASKVKASSISPDS